MDHVGVSRVRIGRRHPVDGHMHVPGVAHLDTIDLRLIRKGFNATLYINEDLFHRKMFTQSPLNTIPYVPWRLLSYLSLLVFLNGGA